MGSGVQHILVCAQDSVLAKKVRFLLARDECEVEILAKPSQLERRLHDGNVQLLILSRSLDGEDAIEMLARFDPALLIPPTIVLGGQPTITADFISVIPDPIDTQAIYRIASEALAYQVVSEETAAIGSEDLTHLGIDRPAALTQPSPTPPPPPGGPTTIDRRGRDEDISFTDVTGLDEIAGRLDLLESADAMLNDAFDVEESDSGLESSSMPNTPMRGRPGPQRADLRAEAPPPILGGLLEPARFAKVLYQCWAKQVSGALIVARDHETLTIHFEAGSPVHVESSIPGDQLGRALVARGRITEAQYADGAKRAIERGLRLGQALIELAFFTQSELGKELGTNARDQIIGCFAARQGAFEFDAKRRAPTEERPYSIPMGHVIAEGLRKHADEPVLREIVGDIDPKYFKLLRPVEDLVKRYPLDAKELAFLEFSGRAYNVSDAAEVAGMSLLEAHKLMGLLITAEESVDFTPGVREFEARIAEERQRSRDLEAKAKVVEEPPPKSLPPPPPPPEERKLPPLPPRPPPATRTFAERSDEVSMAVSGTGSLPGPRKSETMSPPPPPPPPPLPLVPPPSTSTLTSSPPPPPPASSNGSEVMVPPMPVPPNGEGMVPRPLVYAKPLPRGADGAPLETQERSLSREHFQRGVTLLGQGNFASAEEAFRDAVALCSEEHVYLIGLARAIYYNPGYRADGKVPVLKAIVGRAEQLAPEDNRVATLSQWISAAENQLRH